MKIAQDVWMSTPYVEEYAHRGMENRRACIRTKDKLFDRTQGWPPVITCYMVPMKESSGLSRVDINIQLNMANGPQIKRLLGLAAKILQDYGFTASLGHRLIMNDYLGVHPLWLAEYHILPIVPRKAVAEVSE